MERFLEQGARKSANTPEWGVGEMEAAGQEGLFKGVRSRLRTASSSLAHRNRRRGHRQVTPILREVW